MLRRAASHLPARRCSRSAAVLGRSFATLRKGGRASSAFDAEADVKAGKDSQAEQRIKAAEAAAVAAAQPKRSRKPLPNVAALWPRSTPGADVSLHDSMLSPRYETKTVRMGSISVGVDPCPPTSRGVSSAADASGADAANASVGDRITGARGYERHSYARGDVTESGATVLDSPVPIDIGDPDEHLLAATFNAAQATLATSGGSVPTSPAARLSSASGGVLSDDAMGSAGPRTSEQTTIGAEAASLSEGVEGPGSLRGMAANLAEPDSGRSSNEASAGLRDVETATAAAAGQSGSYRGAVEGSADAQEKEQMQKRTDRGERMGTAYVRPQGQAAGSRRGYHTAAAAALSSGRLTIICRAVGATSTGASSVACARALSASHAATTAGAASAAHGRVMPAMTMTMSMIPHRGVRTTAGVPMPEAYGPPPSSDPHAVQYPAWTPLWERATSPDDVFKRGSRASMRVYDAAHGNWAAQRAAASAQAGQGTAVDASDMRETDGHSAQAESALQSASQHAAPEKARSGAVPPTGNPSIYAMPGSLPGTAKASVYGDFGRTYAATSERANAPGAMPELTDDADVGPTGTPAVDDDKAKENTHFLGAAGSAGATGASAAVAETPKQSGAGIGSGGTIGQNQGRR